MEEKRPLFHDSHDLCYRAPFGAVRAGETVTLRLGILDGFYVSDPRVLVFFDGKECSLPMEATGELVDGYHMVEVTFTPESAVQHWLIFAAENGMGVTTYLGDDPQHFGGCGVISYENRPDGFLLNVYEPDFFVPEWFRDAVMYQIFPDRFYRSTAREYPAKPRMHADWNEDVSITPFGDQPHYVADDFFGGNLAGIEEKLDHLAAFGVTVLYLNPVFSSVSNHRYNTADYETIDPLLGTNAEFSHLCAEANKRGIRIILDGVFSHTGQIGRYFSGDPAFAEPGAAQSKDSPYYSWYRFGEWPDTYECWWGDISLPNTEETDPGYRAYMLGENGIVRRWLRAGASGFRLDVADELPDLFLDELFAAVRAEKKDAVVLGEVWENAATKTAYGVLRPYLNGRQLHSVMNYPLRGVLLDYLLGKCGASDVKRVILQMMEDYPSDIFHALMNMTGSHDVPRALSILSGIEDHGESREELRFLEPDDVQRALGKKRLILLFALLFFLPGNPCVYYGDEAGLTGMRDPYCRRPFPWGKEDTELTEALKSIASLRAANPALCGGTLSFLDTADDAVLAFCRERDGQRITVLVNPTDTEKHEMGTAIPPYSYAAF